MDFSIAERAISSLERRTPALPSGVIDLCNKQHGCLWSYFVDQNKGKEGTQAVVKGILQLVSPEYLSRWEPLSVGLFLAMTLIEEWCASLATLQQQPHLESATAAATHYVDGPRLPSLNQDEDSVLAMPSSSSTPFIVSILGGDADVQEGEWQGTMLQFLIDDFLGSMVGETCRNHLEHNEPRVRTLCARTIGAHARLTSLAQSIISSGSSHDAGTTNSTTIHLLLASKVPTLLHQRTAIMSFIVSSLEQQYYYTREEFDASGKFALDDTTGWRSLETSLHAYACWVDGCGAYYWVDDDVQEDIQRNYHQYLFQQPAENKTETLLDILLSCCTKHKNRHVRAAALQTMDQILKNSSMVSEESDATVSANIELLRKTTITILVTTLADNWSQVRMAASVLCRTLLVQVLSAGKTELLQTQIYPQLIPRMCLNRFYLAQGVKLYSQETWKILFGADSTFGGNNQGQEMVARYAGAVCRYYAKMADADNHCVREAACQAIAELAEKIGSSIEYKQSLAPHVPTLLQALVMCFFDESWPVRDEASLACGTFARAYPDECRPELPTLLERWVEQLTDQIWSVREDAAIALADAIRAYGEDVLGKLIPKLRELIPSARNQPPQTREEMLARHNDPEAHTGSQLYSCGSLAPKLGRGSARKSGPCGSNCNMTRDRMPWEATDGCVYMLRELFLLSSCDDEKKISLVGDDLLYPLFEEIIDVCHVKHFPQGEDLRATLWRAIPEMANAAGKQRFKKLYLGAPGFLDLLLMTLEERNTSQLAHHAATQCSLQLASLVGKSILLGRVWDDRQRQVLERALAAPREESLRFDSNRVDQP